MIRNSPSQNDFFQEKKTQIFFYSAIYIYFVNTIGILEYLQEIGYTFFNKIQIDVYSITLFCIIDLNLCALYTLSIRPPE